MTVNSKDGTEALFASVLYTSDAATIEDAWSSMVRSNIKEEFASTELVNISVLLSLAIIVVTVFVVNIELSNANKCVELGDATVESIAVVNATKTVASKVIVISAVVANSLLAPGAVVTNALVVAILSANVVVTSHGFNKSKQLVYTSIT